MTITESRRFTVAANGTHLDEMALKNANETIAAVNTAMLDQVAMLSRECAELRSRLAQLESQPERRPLLNKSQAAEYLNCSISTVYELMASGAIPVVRFDNRPRFRAADLDIWIASKVERSDD